jgi:hypothetical protein
MDRTYPRIGQHLRPSAGLVTALGLFIFAMANIRGMPLEIDEGTVVSYQVCQGACAIEGVSLGRYRTRKLPVIASESIPTAAPCWCGWRAIADDREHRLTRFDFPPPSEIIG